MSGEWRVDYAGAMYDAQKTVSCFRVYEIGSDGCEARTVAVVFSVADGEAICAAHNRAEVAA